METTELKTLSEFCEENGITIKNTRIPSRTDSLMSDLPNHYVSTLIRHCNDSDGRQEKRELSIQFSQGSAHKKQPAVEDVLNCCAADSAGYENVDCFEDWAAEYGYDTDSRKAENIYKTVATESAKLKNFLGQELYDELLWNVEQL